MTYRRELQLQKLGIIQWALRRPTVFQGKINISLPVHVKLVMVADEQPMLNEPLIGDVLRAIKISAYQVLQLSPYHVSMLPPNSRYNSWQLGCKEATVLKGGHLVTPTLKVLQANPTARKALWRQICKYEHDFFSHEGRPSNCIRH